MHSYNLFACVLSAKYRVFVGLSLWAAIVWVFFSVNDIICVNSQMYSCELFIEEFIPMRKGVHSNHGLQRCWSYYYSTSAKRCHFFVKRVIRFLLQYRKLKLKKSFKCEWLCGYLFDILFIWYRGFQPATCWCVVKCLLTPSFGLNNDAFIWWWEQNQLTKRRFSILGFNDGRRPEN